MSAPTLSALSLSRHPYPHASSSSSSTLEGSSSTISLTSGSSSSGSSYNQTTYKRITISSEATPFLDDAQRMELEESANRCSNAICQIFAPNSDQVGTGCLIGNALLLTNHETLPNPESAQSAFAYFFPIASSSFSTAEMVKVSLNPSRYFFTSSNRVIGRGKNKRVLPPLPLRLNFTIVALQITPFLSTIQNSALSILDTVSSEPEDPICVIQFSQSASDIHLQCSSGQIRKVKQYSLTYSTSVEERFSKGVIIDLKGRLIALDHQTISERLYSGVLVNQIAAALERQEGTWKVHHELGLARPRVDRKTIDLPIPPHSFIGREKELQLLQSALLENGKRLAVVGKEGIGKKALALKYADTNRENYSLIAFISSRTVLEIENSLLKLAEHLDISREVLEPLLRLKTKLETSDQRILLIFDQVDDQDTLTYLNNNLPERGCNILLLSSGVREFLNDLPQISLESYSKEEAVAFLLKALEDKDKDAHQASLLAERLGSFPLALKHAASFISSTKGSTIP